MQKFKLKKDTSKGKKGSHKKEFRKVQEKRKKKVESDDAEIATLSSRLWPSFEEKSKV